MDICGPRGGMRLWIMPTAATGRGAVAKVSVHYRRRCSQGNWTDCVHPGRRVLGNQMEAELGGASNANGPSRDAPE